MRYQVTTAYTPQEALEQAVAYFGKSGLGLTVLSQTPLGVVFQGGGGHVAITVQAGTATSLELETREWDYAVQQFMAQVSGRRRWWHRLLRRKRRQPASTFTILNNGNDPNRPR